MRNVRHLSLLLLPLLLGMKPIDPANRIQEDQQPTPYSAEQIRTACAPGTRMTYRVEQPGQPPSVQVTRFIAHPEGKASFENWTETTEGSPTKQPRRIDTEWTSLQKHAAFPASQCTISEGEVTVPAGTFTCWIYRVEQPDGQMTVFDFAQNLPGPPVRMHMTKGEQTLYHMELIARTTEP